MTLSSLVPTSIFAQNFAFRSKDPVGSLPAFVDMLKAKHSDLYNSIYSLPTKAGSAARAAITETTSKLFGVFHAASTHDSYPWVHDAFLIAETSPTSGASTSSQTQTLSSSSCMPPPFESTPPECSPSFETRTPSAGFLRASHQKTSLSR